MWDFGLAAIILGCILAALVGRPYVRRWRHLFRRPIDPDFARRRFYLRREWLEAEFLKVAASGGKPRGLKWVDCDFDNAVQFALDEGRGRLRAFVSVTIRFEPSEPADLGDVEIVSDVRMATIVYEFDGQDWAVNPNAIFNLNPNQAIQHFRHRPVSMN